MTYVPARVKDGLAIQRIAESRRETAAMGIEIDGLAGLLTLSLPLAALATVVFLAARDARRRRGLAVTPEVGDTPAPRAVAAEAPLRAAAPAAASPAPQLAAVAQTGDMPLDQQLRGARELVASGKAGEAAAAFRECLWEAGRQGREDVQGEARRDLGDLCLASGDTITACEHWQIARGYFSGLKRTADVADVERRMKANGCPTDWVLNDF